MIKNVIPMPFTRPIDPNYVVNIEINQSDHVDRRSHIHTFIHSFSFRIQMATVEKSSSLSKAYRKLQKVSNFGFF